jgi:hypothetical protein
VALDRQVRQELLDLACSQVARVPLVKMEDEASYPIDVRSGSGNLDNGMSDGSALCGDDSAADERSREHETTPP